MTHLDVPITKDDDDKLGFNELSEKVAKGIIDYDKNETFIISIEGKWGSGKTSFMNLIENKLKKENNTQGYFSKIKKEIGIDQDKIKIMHFNPWLLTDIETVITLFFSELKILLNSKITKLLDIFENKLKINNIKLKTPIIEVDCLTDNKKSIENIKKDINNILKTIDKKIVIIIDDIDRLTDKETEFIFRLIKGIADFDNLIYILLYDKQIVTQSLSTFKQEDGERYIEKIVQYPLSMPKPHKLTIQSLLLGELDDIKKKLKEKNKQIFDSPCYFQKNIIDTFILTIRDVNKVINIMSFEYPIIAESVNFTDFLFLTIIKIKNIKLYELIKQSYGFIYLLPKITDTVDNEEVIKEDYMQILGIENIYKSILSSLFPTLGKNSDKSSNQHKFKRLADSYYFENYFSFSVSGDKLSYTDFLKIEKSFLSKDIEIFKKNIKDLGNRYIFFVEMFSISATNYESKKYEYAFLNAIIISQEITRYECGDHDNYRTSIDKYMLLSHQALAKISNVDDHLLKFYKNKEISLYIKCLFFNKIEEGERRNGLMQRLDYAMRDETILYTKIEYNNETIEQILQILKDSLTKVTLKNILNDDYYSFNLIFLTEELIIKNDISKELKSFMFKNNKNFFEIINKIKYYKTNQNKYAINNNILSSLYCLEETKEHLYKINQSKLSSEHKELLDIAISCYE